MLGFGIQPQGQSTRRKGEPVFAVPPSISGVPEVGEQLAADPGTVTGTPAPSVSYRWERDGVAIPEATGLSYTLQPADDRARIRFVASATSPGGQASAASEPVTVSYAVPRATGGPGDQTFVQGSGVQHVDAAASFEAAVGGLWSVTGAGASIDQAGRVAIPTDTARAGEVVTVSYANSGGSATVTFEVAVEAVEVTLASPAVIDGLPAIGASLTLTPATYAGDPGRLTNELLRDGVAVATDPASPYTVADADAGAALSYRTTPERGPVSTSVSLAIAAPTAPVPVPVNAAAPSIAGPGIVGQAHEASTGNWDAYDALEYRWTRDGTPIPGATGASYTPVDADDRTDLRVETRASNTGGAWSAWVASTPVPVTQAAPVAANDLSDRSYSAGAVIAPLDIAADFTGAGIVYDLAPSSAPLPAGLSLSPEGTIAGTPAAAAPAATIVVRGSNSGGEAESAFSLTVTEADTTAPTISGLVIGVPDSVTLTVDEVATVYWRLGGTSGQDAETVRAGGGAASGSFAVTTGSTTQDLDLSGASGGTYSLAFVAEDDAGNLSVPAAQEVVLAAELSNASGVPSGATAATGAIDTDTGIGTLHAGLWPATASPSAAEVKAGTGAAFATSVADPGVGTARFSATGLAPETAYRWHFVMDNGADSNLASSGEFATGTPASGGFRPTRVNFANGVHMLEPDSPFGGYEKSLTFFFGARPTFGAPDRSFAYVFASTSRSWCRFDYDAATGTYRLRILIDDSAGNIIGQWTSADPVPAHELHYYHARIQLTSADGGATYEMQVPEVSIAPASTGIWAPLPMTENARSTGLANGTEIRLAAADFAVGAWTSHISAYEGDLAALYISLGEYHAADLFDLSDAGLDLTRIGRPEVVYNPVDLADARAGTNAADGTTMSVQVGSAYATDDELNITLAS